MTKRFLGYFSIFILSCFALFSFTPQKYNKLLWSQNQKVQWKDFTGKAQKSSKAHALTATEISYSLEYNKKKKAYEADVKCLFVKNKSWVKEDPTPELLKHEQLHFDIAELASRKIRMGIVKAKVLQAENPAEKMKDVYKREMQAYEKMQKAYDKETKHSLNESKQLLWNAKIAKALKKHQKYARN